MDNVVNHNETAGVANKNATTLINTMPDTMILSQHSSEQTQTKTGLVVENMREMLTQRHGRAKRRNFQTTGTCSSLGSHGWCKSLKQTLGQWHCERSSTNGPCFANGWTGFIGVLKGKEIQWFSDYLGPDSNFKV